MCGIAGIVSFEGSVQAEEVKSMTDAIAHRGPDGEGCWISRDGRVGLGHRRLSIIDLSDAAAQPMAYMEGQYMLTFNGEIYNYIELREDLKKKGVVFRTSSDTEVLLALYAYYGSSCVNHLDGMFAFVIWDNKTQKLFAARDRFGEKPFYYHRSANRFLFASEMKALWAQGCKRTADAKRLHYYLSYNLYQDPDNAASTFYEDVFQLPPAHTLTIDRYGAIRVSRYWEIDTSYESTITLADACERFDELLRQSIERRLRSDVPVGSSLSGGLDSSTIVLLIDRMKSEGQQQKTFSARFKDFSKDEGEYIDEVLAAARSIQGYTTWPDAGIMSELETIWHHQEEPFGSASIVAQWSVMKLAKEHGVTVLLDGQGADEILGGYRTFFQPLLNRMYAEGDALFAHERDLLKREQRFDYSVNRNTRLMLRYPKTFRAASHVKSMVIPRKAVTAEQKNYNTDFYAQVKTYVHPFTGELNESIRLLQRRIIERAGFTPLLRYADRNSMAHSRELRLPFLSHELVEFCIALPDRYKVSEGWTKRLMRETYKDLLPAKICWRKDKVGFEAPQSEWMKAPGITEQVAASEKSLRDAGILASGKHFEPWHTLMAGKLIRP